MKRTTLGALLMGLLLSLGGLQAQAPKGKAEVKAPAAVGKAAAATTGALIDINRAPAEELRKLPGIGEAYSAAIIKNRPYANKTQLSSKKVIPEATYAKIRDLIVAKQ